MLQQPSVIGLIMQHCARFVFVEASGLRISWLFCDSGVGGLRAILEQHQKGGSMRPAIQINQANMVDEKEPSPLNLEAGAVVRVIERLGRSLFQVKFSNICTDHKSIKTWPVRSAIIIRPYTAGRRSHSTFKTTQSTTRGATTLKRRFPLLLPSTIIRPTSKRHF